MANQSQHSNNSIRIIGGRMRSRRIEFPKVAGLRPTGDRLRETLFNWLQDYTEGAVCLDLFAGSGALGIEALSRGARHVDFVEADAQAAAALASNLHKLGLTNGEVSHAKAEHWLQSRADEKSYDLVFLDPPFGHDAVEALCCRLQNDGTVAANALVYIEARKQQQLPGLPENWEELKKKTAGDVTIRLFRVG